MTKTKPDSNQASQVQRVQRRTLAGEVYEEVRSAILAGRLTPGTALIERQIAEATGASRGPVREALARLTQEGLLSEGPARGTLHVREVSSSDIIDLYNVRLGLEPVAAKLAARRHEPVDELRANLQAMVAAHGDSSRFLELDIAFHHGLCALAHNRYIDQIVAGLAAHMSIAFATDNESYTLPQHVPELLAEHEAILDAIERGDDDGAARAVIDHIMGFGRETGLLASLASPVEG
jgi:DNA-binding GntR family transcriptional regulator